MYLSNQNQGGKHLCQSHAQHDKHESERFVGQLAFFSHKMTTNRPIRAKLFKLEQPSNHCMYLSNQNQGGKHLCQLHVRHGNTKTSNSPANLPFFHAKRQPTDRFEPFFFMYSNSLNVAWACQIKIKVASISISCMCGKNEQFAGQLTFFSRKTTTNQPIRAILFDLQQQSTQFMKLSNQNQGGKGLCKSRLEHGKCQKNLSIIRRSLVVLWPQAISRACVASTTHFLEVVLKSHQREGRLHHQRPVSNIMNKICVSCCCQNTTLEIPCRKNTSYLRMNVSRALIWRLNLSMDCWWLGMGHDSLQSPRRIVFGARWESWEEQMPSSNCSGE